MEVSMLIIWVCGVCHMERLYVIVGDVRLVSASGRCMWSWGRFCVCGWAAGEWEIDVLPPQFLWTLKCSEYNAVLKKENQEKKRANPVTLLWVGSSYAGWLYLWISVKSTELVLKVMSLYNWKPQATWSDPQCSVSTLIWRHWQWYQVHAHVLKRFSFP